MPRVRPAAVVAVTALTAALLAGCTDDAGTATGASSAPPASASPAASSASAVATDLLEKAVVKSLAGPLHVEAVLQVSGRTLTIEADTDRTRPTNTLGLKVTGAQQMEVRVVGPDLFLKQAGISRKPWVRIDLNRLSLNSSMLGLIDVRTNLAPVTGVTTIRQTGSGTFEGTLDLNQAAAKAPNNAVRNEMFKLIDEAADPAAVPFKGAVDAQGRLVSLSYDIAAKTAAGLVVARLTLRAFGDKVTVAKPPAADTEKASDTLYQML
jgi:hypothetical protein